MKHTPGPWAIEESKRGAILYIKARDGQVAQTYGEGDFYRTQYPNARRIVGCVNGCEGINPDAVAGLLAMLKQCRKAFEAMPEDVLGHNEREGWPYLEELASRVDAAIAKAEGEA